MGNPNMGEPLTSVCMLAMSAYCCYAVLLDRNMTGIINLHVCICCFFFYVRFYINHDNKTLFVFHLKGCGSFNETHTIVAGRKQISIKIIEYSGLAYIIHIAH